MEYKKIHITFHRVAHNCNYFLVHRFQNTVTCSSGEVLHGCRDSSLIPEPFLPPVFDAASDQRGSWRYLEVGMRLML